MNNRGLSGGEMHTDDLTWREQEVLVLLADRLTNREIAEQLHLAESTVKDYVGKIISKLYVNNRREAVQRAKVLGILDGDRKTTVEPPTNLPAEPTPFIGRREELGEIKRHLKETRLLTLTGPGGIGKSRLALKAALGVVSDFEDGCFFVALAPIRLVENIIQKIAEAVKFPIATHEDPQHQLLRHLRKKQLLLVMDNFEHLLDGVGIVSEILKAAPGVKILATSREKLYLQSETNLIVGGMALPDQEKPESTRKNDAITLFVQSARKVRPGFNPTQDELGQISKICRIVEGMPLAIELAAAWLNILNVDEIASEIEQGLDILSTEVRDAPERHRSIHAVFDYSWSLLDRTERETFMALSVFRGGFTREAARQVARASLPILAGLVNKSFLSYDPDSSRLVVHELLRQYAQEQLDETPNASASAQEAHAAYYAEFIGERWEHLKDKRQLSALIEIEADIENVRTAWRHYLEQNNISQIWKFIYGLWHVYWIRSWNHAGVELFAEAVEALQEEDAEESIALRALAMAFQSYFMAWLGIPEQGYELAKTSAESLEQVNYPKALLFAYDSLCVNAYFFSRITEQTDATDKLVKIAISLDDKWLIAFALFAPSMVALISGDYDEARQLAETNLDIYEEIGDVIGSTMPLIVLGHVALAREEFERAKGLYSRCLKIAQKTGFNYSIQTSSKYLAKVAFSMDDYTEAENHLIQCLTITKEVGFVRDIINLMYEFARLKAAQGNLEEAVELLTTLIQHPTSNQTRWLEGRIRDSAEGLLAKLEVELSPSAYSSAVERAQLLELEEIIAELVEPKQ